MNIDYYRKEIDNLDAKLVEVLNQRMTICKQIGEYKHLHNISKTDNDRENKIIENLTLQEQFNGMVKYIWPVIINFSKTLQ